MRLEGENFGTQCTAFEYILDLFWRCQKPLIERLVQATYLTDRQTFKPISGLGKLQLMPQANKQKLRVSVKRQCTGFLQLVKVLKIYILAKIDCE